MSEFFHQLWARSGTSVIAGLIALATVGGVVRMWKVFVAAKRLPSEKYTSDNRRNDRRFRLFRFAVFACAVSHLICFALYVPLWFVRVEKDGVVQPLSNTLSTLWEAFCICAAIALLFHLAMEVVWGFSPFHKKSD